MSEPLQLQKHAIRINGVSLAYFERPGPGDQTLLLVHATGMHSRVWDATIKNISPKFRVLSLDLRGHGGSANEEPFTWKQFGSDVQRFCVKMELNQVVAVGHSMGGHSVLQACLADPGRYRALVLIDPVIRIGGVPEAQVRLRSADNPGEHPVARRRLFWETPEAMFNRLRERGPFDVWRPDVLYSYCWHGLEPDIKAGFRLCCPPAVEAQIYMQAAHEPGQERCQEIKQRVTVIRAAPREPDTPLLDFSKSPTSPRLASAFPRGRDVFLPHLSHFIPMQRPDLVAHWINAQLALTP